MLSGTATSATPANAATMCAMKTWRSLGVLVVVVALAAMAWRMGQWQGLAVLGSGLVLWFLLYYTRVMTVIKRANDRPIGYVGSAVMLNAKLKPGLSMLHVMAMTHSLGERQSAEGVEPEVYRWRDPGDSFVTAEFRGGKLQTWRLERPAPAPESPAEPPPSEA